MSKRVGTSSLAAWADALERQQRHRHHLRLLRQTLITLSTVAGLALINIPGNSTLQLAGSFTLLAGQPLWLFETYTNKQWGMFIVTVAYTGAWIAMAWQRLF